MKHQQTLDFAIYNFDENRPKIEDNEVKEEEFNNQIEESARNKQKVLHSQYLATIETNHQRNIQTR